SFLYIQTACLQPGDIAPADVRVSADGRKTCVGKTWQNAPVHGVPGGQRAARNSAMIRTDGTLVMLFRSPQVSFVFDDGTLQGTAYYAWKPGADAGLALRSRSMRRPPSSRGSLRLLALVRPKPSGR